MKAATATTSTIQGLDVWKICDPLSIVQAALLILGLDPSEFEGTVSDKPDTKHPAGYDPVFQALRSAVTAGQLKASVVSEDLSACLVVGMYPEEKQIIEMSKTDWKETTVQVADLKAWLLSKNMKPDFFFHPDGNLDPLNKDGKCYAPRLAAAIRAWTAVADDDDFVKACGNPKQAIETWLSRNGYDYGLINEDGEITANGFDQISAVANWEPAGGRKKGSSQSELSVKKKAKK